MKCREKASRHDREGRKGSRWEDGMAALFAAGVVFKAARRICFSPQSVRLSGFRRCGLRVLRVRRSLFP
jgi:hypothetical protein